MKRTDLIKSIVLIVVIVLVFSAAMFALNFHTGPLIEANNAGAVYGPLLAVMPEGASFDGEAQIYAADGSVATTLANVPETVTAIYKEANGMGYAVKTSATSQYSKAPMEITLGVDAEGKIIKVQIDAYNDTESYDFRVKDPGYLDTYMGQDSALADVGLVAGTTFSSTAFKQGVSDGLNALIVNGLIAEGVKGDDQLLAEMLPTVFPGMADLTGNLKNEALEGVDGTVAAYKALNDSGFAYIVPKGDTMVMAVVNAVGSCKVYDTEGNDVTADNADAVSLATAHAAAHQADNNEAAQSKFAKMMEGAENMTALNVTTHGTVVAAASFNVGGEVYYGFYSKSYGFEDMDVYVILDASGAIAKVDAKTVFFEADYFPPAQSVDTSAYKAGFSGLTEGSWGAGDVAVVSGATMTSNSMKQSVNDAFEAFAGVEIVEPEEVATNE